MGLGGYLTWTAAARAVRRHLNEQIKILPIESHGNLIKTIKSDIFKNNEDFYQNWENDCFTFPFILNNPETNYCKRDTPEKAVHRYDKHIIEQICENFGISNPELKCVINLDEKEKEKVEKLTKNLPEKFITINVDVNLDYTKNKFNIFEKWQNIVDKLKNEFTFVQIGLGSKKLEGVIDLTKRTTFREAAGIIGKSSLFVGSEGGLVHAANAFDVPSVVVITSFIHPDLVKYPGNFNLWLNDDNHGPCGMKVHCQKCHDNMKSLNEDIVCKAITEKIRSK